MDPELEALVARLRLAAERDGIGASPADTLTLIRALWRAQDVSDDRCRAILTSRAPRELARAMLRG